MLLFTGRVVTITLLYFIFSTSAVYLKPIQPARSKVPRAHENATISDLITDRLEELNRISVKWYWPYARSEQNCQDTSETICTQWLQLVSTSSPDLTALCYICSQLRDNHTDQLIVEHSCMIQQCSNTWSCIDKSAQEDLSPYSHYDLTTLLYKGWTAVKSIVVRTAPWTSLRVVLFATTKTVFYLGAIASPLHDGPYLLLSICGEVVAQHPASRCLKTDHIYGIDVQCDRTDVKGHELSKRVRLHDYEQSICEGFDTQVRNPAGEYVWRTQWEWVGSICSQPGMMEIVHICQKTLDLRADLLIGEILLSYKPCPPNYVCLDWFAGNKKWERIPKAYCVPRAETQAYRNSPEQVQTCSNNVLFESSASRPNSPARSVELINMSLDVVGGKRKMVEKLWFEDLSSGRPQQLGISLWSSVSRYHYVLGSATTIIKFCALISSKPAGLQHSYKFFGGGITGALTPRVETADQYPFDHQHSGKGRSVSTTNSAGFNMSHIRQKRSAMVNNLCQFLDSWSYPDEHGHQVRYTQWIWAMARCHDQWTILFACIKVYDMMGTRPDRSFLIYALYPCRLNHVCRAFPEQNVYWADHDHQMIWTAECVPRQQTRDYQNERDQAEVCSGAATYDPRQAQEVTSVDLTLSLSNAAYGAQQPSQQQQQQQRRHARVVHELWFEDVTPGKPPRRLGDTFDKSIASYQMALTALVVIRFCALVGTSSRDVGRGRPGHYPKYDFYGGGYIHGASVRQTENVLPQELEIDSP